MKKSINPRQKKSRFSNTIFTIVICFVVVRSLGHLILQYAPTIIIDKSFEIETNKALEDTKWRVIKNNNLINENQAFHTYSFQHVLSGGDTLILTAIPQVLKYPNYEERIGNMNVISEICSEKKGQILELTSVLKIEPYLYSVQICETEIENQRIFLTVFNYPLSKVKYLSISIVSQQFIDDASLRLVSNLLEKLAL